MPRRLSRALPAALAAAVTCLITAAPAAAAPIADANYDGKAKGDGQSVSFQTSFNGSSLGAFALTYDARCVQGGDSFESPDQVMRFRRLKVDGDGRFEARRKKGGGTSRTTETVKGRFSGDGRTASGKFAFLGKSRPTGFPKIRCEAKGGFEARTGEDAVSEHEGSWDGTTAQGYGIGFSVARVRMQGIEFGVDVTCVRDPGATGEPVFTQEYLPAVEEGDVDGNDFLAVKGPERIAGTFDGRSATGAITIGEYHDDFADATCSSGGEIPFTLRKETRREAEPRARDTVTISGRAYRFNHMDTYIAGATIRVRELPKLSAVTDANGDYELEVPDDTTVTPYIEPGDPYNTIDLQTFHTRGEDIENANFQTPHDDEYNALAALLGVPIGPDGRPTTCVVVSTVSNRNVRGVPYETFHERTPHGVPGATARGFPPVPGPIYFNEFVIPDESETATSEDGGVIWESVDSGPHRFVASHPDREFASFLATCEPGRVVNANPPWGLYELGDGEEPLGAGIVAASLAKAKAKRSGKVVATLSSAEPLDVVVEVTRKGKKLGSERFRGVDPGSPKLGVDAGKLSGRAKVTVRMTDAAGDEASDSARVG